MTDTLREQLIDSVEEDDRLTPEEKDTNFGFTKAENRVRIYSEEAGIIRRLLAHPEVEIVEVRQETPDGYEYVKGADLETPIADDRATVALRAECPIGLLFVKGKSRQAEHHAEVVTHTPKGHEDDGGG